MSTARKYVRVYLPVPVLLVLLASYLFFHTSSWKHGRYFSPPEHDEPGYWTWQTPSRFRYAGSNTTSSVEDGDLCASFPTYLLSTIQVVLKIGASEARERLDAHVSSVTKCIDNLIVVSDAEHELGPYNAHDILADLPPSYAQSKSDFEVYNNEKKVLKEGDPTHSTKGWKLDRYKFLPMVERAFTMNPVAEWFVFIESDTYVVWDNLFRLLENLSPSTPLYMGSPAPGRKPSPTAPTVWFAYGGSGFVLSAAAAQKLLDRKVGSSGEYVEPSLVEKYREEIEGDCCGDSVLGWALWEKGIRLTGFWPLFNPHSLHDVPYSEGQWCQPVITLHRTFPEDMISLWQWEQRRDRTRPLLYSDLIEYARLGSFDVRADWDNVGWDGFQEPDGSPAHSSIDACRKACHDHSNCYQYNYHLKRCTFVKTIRLGLQKDGTGEGSAEDQRFMAGWDVEKIQDWKKRKQCDEVHWVKPSIKRIF